MKRMKRSYAKYLLMHQRDNFIKIYTDWVNRHLIRYGAEPISDLTNDLRQPQVFVTLLRAVTFDCVSTAEGGINSAIAGHTEPTEIVAACLRFISSLNVDISKIAVSDILNGHLGAILSLLYALSTYKQQFKQSARAAAAAAATATAAFAATQPSTSRVINSPSQLPKVRKSNKATTPPCTTSTMPPNSKLPSPSIRTSCGIHSNATANAAKDNSRLATPTGIKILLKDGYPPPCTAATPSRFTSPKVSALRAPTVRVRPPKDKKCNDSEQSRPSSRSSSLASSGTYTSIPSATSSAPSTSASSSVTESPSNQKMLRIKFFGGNKDKQDKTGTATTATNAGNSTEAKGLKMTINQNNGEMGKSSGLVKPKGIGLKTPRRIPGTTREMTKSIGARTNSGLPTQTSSSQNNLQAVKRASNRTPQSSVAAACAASVPATTTNDLKPTTSTVVEPKKSKRFSKSSEEDSAYAGFGSSSPISSAESSSMSLNSTSSRNSSCSGLGNYHLRARTPCALAFQHSGSCYRLNNGTIQPPSSPHESKPVLAVKGISAPKVTRLTPPSSKFTSPKTTNPRNSPVTDEPTSLKWSSSEPDSDQHSEVTVTPVNPTTSPVQNIATTLTTSKSSNGGMLSQSPTVGVVSPMMSHRVIKMPQTSTNTIDGGNQSDASTTSGSRDSDSVSVIYNPSEDTKSLPNTSIKASVDKAAPPVPIRTNSRLETTFDSNCGVTTAEVTVLANNIPTLPESDLEGICPMEPIIPFVPPPYNVVIRSGKTCQQNAYSSATRNGTLPDSSTSEDSLDSISTTIRCGAPNRPSGYLSDGESLFSNSATLPELSMTDLSNGYMSEGGITVYARKMQARFKEGLEAVRDSMQQRHHEFNDSFEDSSSISSGISENFDDISTDDLTGSSLSDYPMAATAAAATYGKLNDYQHQFTAPRQHQIHPKRSSSASQPHSGGSSSNSTLRLQQRRLLEQENIDQLFQKCRTTHRGVACSAQASRYNNCGQHAIYHTMGNIGHPVVPQLTLSDDGDTLCVRNGSARASLRMPSKQDHQVQAGPGFSSMTGYHSLDRKTHLLNYYGMPDENPYRLAVVGQETSAATLAMVSPRHVTNRQHFTLAQPNMDSGLANRHSVAASRSASLSAAGMSRSMVLVAGGTSDTECGTSQPSTPDNPSNCRIGNRSPLITNPKMVVKRIPFSIAAEITTDDRDIASGSLSSRKCQTENVYANYTHRDANLQLHKLSDDGMRTPQMKTSRYAESGYLSAASKLSPIGPAEGNASQFSLTSSSNSLFSSMEEKYEAEIRKLNREMEAYRNTITKLTAKHDGYNHLIQLFESKLQLMAKHVENLQNKSQLKKDEVLKLRAEIEQLRVMSINAGVNVSSIATITQRKNSSPAQSQDGAGELLRHPSLESVTSHRSSMSSSSKGSKTDKSSLNSFGKQNKKSWIRSSFSKFTKSKKVKSGSVSDAEHSPMHTSSSPSSLKPISGSASRLDELESVPQVVELKKQLEDKDSALTDVRLDALDKAREVDILKETINRLKNENKILKQNYTLLERRMRAESRASSQQSLPTLPDEDPVYEVPPANERCLTSRSSNCLKVTVSVDFSGLLRPRSSAGEVSIGFIQLPASNTTWEDFDIDLFKLFDDYMAKIDPCRALEMNSQESIIGYEFGDFVRDIETNSAPSPLPIDVLTHSHEIRIYLKGVTQRCTDGLVMDCLFPRATIEQLLKALLQNRRLVLFGATGIGKSNLARLLARYMCIKIGGALQNSIVDIKIGDDDNDRSLAQVQKQLESLLRSTKPLIILLDNIQRHRIAFLSSSFNSVDSSSKEGPYVICTVNRASQLPELQVQHNFRMFLLPNNVDAIRGYMGRFLRRRILEKEFGGDERSAPEIYRIIEFLPRVLSSVNSFIEKANSRDVTIGPRLFLQCPLNAIQSREWFIKLWNQMIIPYMIKVAKEGVKVLGRCGSFEDPTDFVCEQWPWLDGPAAEQVLKRLSPIKETMFNQPNSTQFDPLEALIRIQSNNANSQQEVVQ